MQVPVAHPPTLHPGRGFGDRISPPAATLTRWPFPMHGEVKPRSRDSTRAGGWEQIPPSLSPPSTSSLHSVLAEQQ